MYPTIIPTISNITLLRTIVEKRIIMPNINTAPIKAPAKTAIVPERANDPKEPNEPPKNNITKATPKLAPELIPKIDGPANGLLNAVCNIKPETAKAAPAKNAVTA